MISVTIGNFPVVIGEESERWQRDSLYDGLVLSVCHDDRSAADGLGTLRVTEPLGKLLVQSSP